MCAFVHVYVIVCRRASSVTRRVLPTLLFLLCIVASTDVRRTTVLRTVQEPEDLFEVISQCLLSAVDRDALSGWGAVITIMYVVPG